MTSHHASEADSPSSTPRSDHPSEPRVRLMCSFGGRILPRPHDNQLRYVGGDTRIVAVHRSTTFSSLQSKLSKLSNNPSDVTLKYQLPNEELDSLISVTTDEDVENMMEEYDRLVLHHHHSGSATRTPRLRLFLFCNDTSNSNNSSIGSLLGGSSKRENWFLDALNGQGLERGRSEVSSIVSEVPDYLFGLDNSDDSKPTKYRPVLSENLSVVSDPGSPAPPVSSPYCSSSSPMPDLPPVKTKVETQVDLMEAQMGTEPVQTVPQPAAFGANPVWHYLPETSIHGPGVQPMQVYYVQAPAPAPAPSPAPPGKVPVQPVAMHMQYAHQAPAAVGVGQIPVGFPHPVQGQVYGPGMAVMRQTMEGYEFPVGVGPDGVAHQQQQQQQAYYAATRNVGVYPTAGMAGEMLQGGGGLEMKIGRISQSN